MTLKSVQLFPRGDAGWGSGQLEFGTHTTLLLGPNGAGKTPVVKAIAYALGHPVELPPLIRERCYAVKLTIMADGIKYEIERQLAPGVDVQVAESSQPPERIQDERSLSEWVFRRLGISLRTLSGKNGGTIPPYMSVVGPMFLVDQDVGWTASYVPFETHQFVKDQREEVVRWLLDIPARNKPIDKSEFEAAKTNWASIQEQIAFKRKALEQLQRELGEDRVDGTAARLEARRVVLEAELARVHSALQDLAQVESILDTRIREATQQRDQVSFRLANIKRRKAQLSEVQSEVGAELGALEQNEIAAEAFRALCGNEACQFFRKPEDSYGRRVLYLKDQLKDFESSAGETERELVILQQQMATADEAVAAAIASKKRSLEADTAG
jgi:hypothetical protein